MDSPLSPVRGGFAQDIVRNHKDSDTQVPDAAGQSIVAAGDLRITGYIIHYLNQFLIAIDLIAGLIILGRDTFMNAMVEYINAAFHISMDTLHVDKNMDTAHAKGLLLQAVTIITTTIATHWIFMAWVFIIVASLAVAAYLTMSIKLLGHVDTEIVAKKVMLLIEAPPTTIDSAVEAPITDILVTKAVTINTEVVAKKVMLLIEAPPTTIDSAVEAPITGVLTTKDVTIDTKAPTKDVTIDTKAPITKEVTVDADAPTTKDASRNVPPHLRKKKNVNADAPTTKDVTIDTKAPTTKEVTVDADAPTTKDASRNVPPHLRKKKNATPAAESKVTKTVDSKTTGKTVDVAGPSGSSTDLKATAPGFGVLRGNKNATTSGVKPIKATSSTAISDQKRSRRARASHPQRRNFNKFRPTQPIERGAHTERATLGGWGDVLTTVRKDDIAIRAANEAKAEATKHLEPGEWTTKFAPRATKTS